MVLTPPCCWCLWSAVWFCCSSSLESSSSAAGKPPGPTGCQSSHRYCLNLDAFLRLSPCPCGHLCHLSLTLSVILYQSFYLFCSCCPPLSLPVHQSGSHGSSSFSFPLSRSLFPCCVTSGIVTGRWQLCLISLRCAATGLCAVCVEIRREHVPFPREPRRTAGRRMCAYVYVCVLYSIRVAVILPGAKRHGCFALIKQLFLAKLSASYTLTPLRLSSATFPFHKASSYCVQS